MLAENRAIKDCNIEMNNAVPLPENFSNYMYSMMMPCRRNSFACYLLRIGSDIASALLVTC
jgi:hypothetical protein